MSFAPSTEVEVFCPFLSFDIEFAVFLYSLFVFASFVVYFDKVFESSRIAFMFLLPIFNSFAASDFLMFAVFSKIFDL